MPKPKHDNYIVLSQSEDGFLNVAQMDKGILLERLDEEYWGPNVPILDYVPFVDDGAFTERGIVVIKGEVIIPGPEKTVTKWKLP